MDSLRSNNTFIRLFLGRLVTNMGDSIYYIGSMWLVYSLTGSAFYTGIAGFLVRIPSSLQFLVGPLVDRWSLRSLLVSTQLVQGIAVLVVPLAHVTGHLSVWVVLVLMPFLTLLNQFVYPAQSAALPRIVDDDQLVRANSLFSLALRGSDMAFNAASGVLIGVVGAVSLFVVDSITFGIAVTLFFGVSVPGRNESERAADDESNATWDLDVEAYLSKLTEGLRYIRGSILTEMLLGGSLVNFVFGMMIAVLPAFSDTIGGAEVFGLLMAAEAAGTLAGSASSSFVEDYPLGHVTVVGYLSAAVFWTGAIAIQSLPVTVALFCIAFVPIGVINVMLPSMVQSSVDESLIARVMSVFSSASTVTLPIGSLVGGAVAQFVGPVNVMYGGSVAFVFFGLYFLSRPQLRTLPSIVDINETSLRLQ